MRHCVLLLFVALNFGAQAQGVYRGGKGGGWASATAQLAQKSTFDLRVYSSGDVYLTTVQGVPSGSEATLALYDCLGRQIGTRKVQKGTNRLALPAVHASGIYILVVEAGRKRLVEKVIL